MNLKFFLAYLPLTFASITCFGQFTEISPREGRIKGKVDSVVFANYNIVKSDTGEAREFNDKCTYLYNLRGLLVEARNSDNEGTYPAQFRTVYTYDDKGHLSQVLDYSRKGVLRGKGIYTFDPAKRLLEVRSGGGNVTSRIQLDKVSNVVESTDYRDYPTPFTTMNYKYDRNGLCIESVQIWAKSADLQKIVYEYDANHDLVKETVYNNLKLLATYAYTYSKYDNQKNWLMQHTYRNGKIDGVTERTIVYR
jgi:hypothetical protein